jgi:hypothetical protein
MLWAVASSAFVIYLYRKLNAPGDAESTESAVPESVVDQALANLDNRLHALESIVNAKTGRVAP